jgi:hypothetical protein
VVTLTKADTSILKHEGECYYLETTHRASAAYKLPPLAHACQESRALCLTRYRPCFEGPLEHPVLFDPKTDLLLMADLYALSSFLGIPWDSFSRGRTDWTDIVQYLAICGNWETFTDLLLPRLEQFNNLEHVILEKPRGVYKFEMAQDPSIAPFVTPVAGHMAGMMLRELESGLSRKWGNPKDFKVPKLAILDRWEFAATAVGR